MSRLGRSQEETPELCPACEHTARKGGGLCLPVRLS